MSLTRNIYFIRQMIVIVNLDNALREINTEPIYLYTIDDRDNLFG